MAGDRYLIRFDDICPTMNWTVWEAIERHLDLHGIRPILAVVPDNQDPKLMPDPPVPDFWDRVRAWQAKGYSIGLHGYQHVYVNADAGLVGVTKQSEFAGLPHADQEAKLSKAFAIFAEQGVRPDVWVAPSHSFDRTTIQVLGDHGLKVISDGLWPWPHLEGGETFWVPQQLWGFMEKGPGVWTVCCHHNDWSEARVASFAAEVAAYASRMTDLPTVLEAFAGRTLTFTDRVRARWAILWNHTIRHFLGSTSRRILNAGRAS